MKLKSKLSLFFISGCFLLSSQNSLPTSTPTVSLLRLNLNEGGSKYFQAVFMNQVWLRYNENNPGTTRFSKPENNTFDIGLRRTRIQLYGSVSERVFLYFQFGQNNFNSTFNYTGNRKLAAFFHDALGEYKVTRGNELKLGAGLTILNGLSRFSQPSVGTIMTLDVPVFLQYSVDQTDQFARRLAVYARGQIKKLDYRVYLSNPFPISSSGITPVAISENATFVNTAAFSNGAGPGINHQYGTYLTYNFFENENHVTPYMVGTLLGEKKVFNISAGAVYQKNATWHTRNNFSFTDTAYSDLFHLGLEAFLDLPISSEDGTALNAFAGVYKTDYGKNYLRFNGIMNPATGTVANNLIQSGAFGNSFPMFGTGNVIYAQFGYLLPKKILGKDNGQLLPYVSGQFADFDALQNKKLLVYNAGISWLISAHSAKLSLEYSSRPTYYKNLNNQILSGDRRGCITMQYQITIN